ncbi:MAG TPA: YfhO family protein [Conexibacter sp.]|nr:YfhO family protein [Conexibacter sp.]
MGDGGRRFGARIATCSHVWATLALAAVVLAYLWPVLVGGKILSPLAILYSSTPWRGFAPPDVHNYLNTLLVDLPLVDYPWRVLARSFIHEGTFPAWNPYALGGIPFYSNTQTGIFSPFNVPLWTLPLTYGLGVSAALKLFVGALGTYVLVRQLRLGALAGVLAGIAFAFSAINITWLAHETLPGVAVMLPWTLWLVERICARGRPGSMIALAGVTAVGLGGGHPAMQIHLLVLTAVYALVRVACLRGATRGDEAGLSAAATPLRALALVGGGLLAGVLLMAFMLIPEERASHGTVGVLARQAGELPSSRMPFRAIATAFFPDYWGRPSALEARATAANQAVLAVNYCERTFYAGTVALLLALVGLVASGGWRQKLPFAIVGALGMAVAVHVPGLIWLARNLPVLDLVEPERLHFGFELAVAVLAGFGLQAVLDAPAGDRRRLAVVLLAVFGGALAFVAVEASGADLDRTVDHFLTGVSSGRGDVLALTSVVWLLLFVLGAGALLLLARTRPGWRTAVSVALVLLAVADSYHFVHGFQPMGPASRVVPPTTPAIDYLTRHRDDGRVVGLGLPLPPDSGLVYGLRDVRGYDPPQPTTRLLALWRLMSPEQTSWQPLSLSVLRKADLQVLGVLGARYLIADVGLEIPRTSFPQVSLAYDGPDARVFENADVPPRAFVPATVRVTSDERATGAAIVEPRFDVRTEVAVEGDQGGIAALREVTGSATIVAERNARVQLRATLDRRGLVVLNDSLMPGWSVRVDDREVTPIHVNSVMRGVLVPPGSHAIVWSYEVPGLRLGALLSAVTLALLVAAAVALRRRARRPATAPVLRP